LSKDKYFLKLAEALKKSAAARFFVYYGWVDRGVLVIYLSEDGEWGLPVATVHPYSGRRVQIYWSQHDEIPGYPLGIRDLIRTFGK
jgi:hypothetical protein